MLSETSVDFVSLFIQKNRSFQNVDCKLRLIRAQIILIRRVLADNAYRINHQTSRMKAAARKAKQNLMTSRKVHLLRCAASFVIAAYPKVRLAKSRSSGFAYLASGFFLQSHIDNVTFLIS